MPSQTPPTYLLASPDPALLASLQLLFLSAGDRVEIVLAAEAVLSALIPPHPPQLVLLDTTLPGMPVSQLLAAMRADPVTAHIPIVLIADSVTEEWIDRLAECAVDDVILRSADLAYWQLRLDMVLRSQRMIHELETLRDTTFRNAQLDRLTGVYNRETLLAMLFRETDRVQRMQSVLSLVFFDIDDFGHWNSRLGIDACDELLCQIASRTGALLRSYDLLGRPGMDGFLIALPSCGAASAMALTERLRMEVFALPFHVAGESIRLSACFGISVSQGRSPVVVLREAEKALEWAKASGPESIQCYGTAAAYTSSPVTFLSSSSGDELLAW